MQSNVKTNTKCKILECAKLLFAKKGVDGTSIREITNEADVNLSAINYHFKSKENLYKEIFREEIKKNTFEIDKIGSKSENLEDLTYKVFLYYKKHQTSILFLFHAFLNLDIDPKDLCREEKKIIAPPGNKTFLKQLNIDLKSKKNKILEEQKLWAIRTIMAHIMHFALTIQSPLLRKMEGKVDFLKQAKQEQSIKQLARAIFKSL